MKVMYELVRDKLEFWFMIAGSLSFNFGVLDIFFYCMFLKFWPSWLFVSVGIHIFIVSLNIFADITITKKAVNAVTTSIGDKTK